MAFYLGGQLLQRRDRSQDTQSILIAIACLISFLCFFDIDFETYQAGGEYRFLAQAGSVALGVPVNKQLSAIRKQLVPLLVSELAGCVAGIVSVLLLARLFGATLEVAMSLAPKLSLHLLQWKCLGYRRNSSAYSCGGGVYRHIRRYGRFRDSKNESYQQSYCNPDCLLARRLMLSVLRRQWSVATAMARFLRLDLL